MVAGIGLRTLARVIHAGPTQAEAIRKAAEAYNRTRPWVTAASWQYVDVLQNAFTRGSTGDRDSIRRTVCSAVALAGLVWRAGGPSRPRRATACPRLAARA